MTLFLALFGMARASEVEIGVGGTATNQYLPGYNFFNYSWTQQIYTATEIGMAGTINSVAFYNAGAEKTRTYNVYMALTDKETFESGTDWVAMSDGDLVFDGELTFTVDEWTTIDLDTPFAYDGSSNLLIGVADVSGSYSSSPHMACYVFDATSQAIRAYRDGSAYDIANPAVTGTVMDVKNQIVLDITTSSGPTCDRPATLEVSNITTSGASFAWENTGAASYTFEYKKASDTDWTVASGLTATTYSLNTLESATAYNARVKAVCGTDLESTYKTANFTTKEVCPDGFVCIGEGTATNIYIPTYTYYNYSLTQQIYTADEIGEAGYILSVDFHSSAEQTRTLSIYMVSTTKSSFDSNTDWIAATSSDLVFTGDVTFAADAWTNIEFDTPFSYDGTSNVALIVDDNTGSYVTAPAFYAFNATSQAIRVYSDGTNYDPADPSSYTGTVLTQKNRIRLEIGEPPACPKPAALAVNYEGDLTAEVTWSGDATSYDIDVNGTVTTGVTSPYTLDNLELSTDYEVMVRANCGSDGYSEWAGPVTFTTDDCMLADMTTVNYTLNDSYGDGWNSNYILVVDASCNIVDYLTIENGSTLTGTVKVCGSYVQFLWYAGSYPGETSWEFTDADGNALFSGTGSTNMATYDVIYTIDSSPYPAPSDITVSDIGPYGATIAWTENGTATAWEIMLDEDEDNIIPADSNPFTVTGLDPETEYFVQVRATGSAGTSMWPCVGTSFTTLEGCTAPALTVTPYPFSAYVDWTDWEGSYDLDWCLAPASKDGGIWMQYENGTVTANIGSSSSVEQTWGVMYPIAMLQGNKSLTKVAFYVNATYHTSDFTVNIYQGDDPISGTLLGTQTVTPATTSGMMEVELTSPITINPLQNLWITLTTTGTYVKTGANVSDPNAQWVLSNGEWVSVASLNSALAAYGWMIRGYVEGYNPLDFDWTSETGVTPPYTIDGLDAQTQYVVRVKATCGDAWTWYYFTTPSACDAPVNLETTDITYNSATLNWLGYQDGYGIRYREASKYEAIWEEDFESDLSEWTVIAGINAEVPGTAAWYTYDPTGGLEFEAHSGSYCASSWSWTNNTEYQANNWLITPQLDLQGVLKYYVRTNQGYPDKYEVLLSTTTADTTSFTISLVDYALAPATGAWEEVIVDLSAYEGQQGYIAIRHLDYDANYLLIDDFGIYNAIDASDWMEEDARDNTLEITDLTPGTDYEWQVRGENDDCTGGEEDGYTDWSEIATFTTEGLPTQTIELAAGWNWVSINMEITMADLKDAIIAANPGARPVIKSKGNGQTTYTGVMWSGALASLDLSQMYMIKVANACTLTLQGTPIEAAAHPATINNGANWIAYPFDVEMTIEDAFNSFATMRDVVKSKSDGQATKLAAMWSGALKKLEPGKGYIYNSKKTTSATFTFPTPTSRSASKAAVTSDPAFNRTIPCIDMYK